MTPQRLEEIKNGGAAATPGEREEIFALAKSALGAPELASLAQMVCSRDNWPHPYVGDPEGFARDLETARPEVEARDGITVSPALLDVLVCVAQGQRRDNALSATALHYLKEAEALLLPQPSGEPE